MTALMRQRWTRSCAADWFAGLFRSFDTRRGAAADSTKQRADHMRVVARAEMQDAEPVLHAALSGALAGELDAALARHGAWLDREIAAARAQIHTERAALEDLHRVRDRAYAACADLDARIEALERELPGTAAASAAAR